MSQKRMGGLKLTDFGGKQPSTVDRAPAKLEPSVQTPPARTKGGKPAPQAEKPVTQEKLVTVNIKITHSQQEWLADTAKQIRGNNSTPVPPGDRVYPQHLIQVAVDLLQNSGLDWTEIRNVEELKKLLSL